MFGHHGPASAPGARTAVLSDSLRRTVLLLGLLVGVLTAGWVLGATDAEAEEISVGADTVTVDAPVTDTVDLVGDTLETEIEEPVDQSEVAESSQVTEVPRSLEAVEAPTVDETFETTETAEAGQTEEPRPLTDTVAQTGREATASVREISETDVPEIVVDGDDLAEPVQWAVDEITRTVDDRLDRVETPPRWEAAPDPASGEEPATQPESVEDRDDVLVTPESQGPETAVDLLEHADPTVTGSDTVTGDTPFHDQHGSTPTGTASASQGTVTGLAGHLSAAGTPIPALAFEDATRHVLRAVPTAGADEPTFAPD
ncbi:hypothetical protein [Nocardiopsis sp. JB363]|uniref:hypothetical protein n=1 Tax=Nocardiopsis sp. JB363 TaxID=1434837 RepID=UPI00097AAE29|nr:hypothetical protein [Nocardiopsis sp. JB363]SIO87857.1 hypothetical protein BQ8420_17570 [Nocardiopsis sp. JB363]